MSQSSRQLWILGVAFTLWMLWGEPAFWAAAASYLCGWALFNWGGWSKLTPPQAPRAVALSAVALLLAGPLFAFSQRAQTLILQERVYGLGENLSDRLRLERRPAITPPVVVADRPQTFYVHAPGADRVTVSFGGAALAATGMGHGLFRIDYDPQRDGPPLGPARIDADGAAFEREMLVVHRYAHPRWLVAEPSRGVAAAVSEETDTLLLVDRSGGLRSVPVGDSPTDVAFFDGGRKVAIAHRHSPALFVVDVETAAVVARPELSAFVIRLAVSGSGRRLAASVDGERRGVLVAELPDLEGPANAESRPTVKPAGFAPLPYTPDWLTFVDDETLVVAVREPRALVRVARRNGGWEMVPGDPLYLGRPVVTATRRPGASRLYITTTAHRTDGGMPGGNHFVQDQILTVDLERFTIIDQLLTGRGDGRQDDPGIIESGGSPMGLALRDDGSLLVAFAGTDEVWRLPAGSRIPEVLLSARKAGVPLYDPHGVADLGEGRWAVTSPAAGAIAVFDAESKLVSLHQVAPPDEELASRDPAALARRRGERTFYESTRKGLSCQSCHLHGEHDYSAHDITSRGKQLEFLRATLSTAGIAGTAPYLRNGGFPHIHDLSDVAHIRYQGYRRPEAGRPASLEAFVESIPLPLNPRVIEGRDLERERRGVDAFVKGSCTLCHAFPAFTNLSQHPIRALFPRFEPKVHPGELVDTPSLLGLRTGRPYLADGRAATVSAVLHEHNPDNRHGDTAALSDAEIDDLIYFLESL